jgi:hypothetical protein
MLGHLAGQMRAAGIGYDQPGIPRENLARQGSVKTGRNGV